MKSQYVPLSDLDDHPQPPRQTQSPQNSFMLSMSRIPRKWLMMGITATICVILWLSFHPLNDKGYSQNSPSDVSAGGKPLLGEVEDVSKLWYPALSQQSKFQPSRSVDISAIDPLQRPRTPLFIGFTRNNDMLIQAVLSYIAAGWPASDIIVIDNSGTMDANPRGLLTASNPFYLDYSAIRSRYGASVLQTPTLLSFAQLQNFFLRTAMAHGWPIYFWSHMDVAVLSDETISPYESFYSRVLGILRDHGVSGPDPSRYRIATDWGLRYFTYDWLTLINVEAWRTVGSWDVFIPYYATDCDAYSRVALHGLALGDVRAGPIYDVASILADPEEKFFAQTTDEPLNSPRYQRLRQELEDMMAAKTLGHRNEWQAGKGQGGKGEPWTYDPQGFQSLWWDTAEFGRNMYKKKWGTLECRLDEVGFSLEDEFAHT